MEEEEGRMEVGEMLSFLRWPRRASVGERDEEEGGREGRRRTR